MTRRRSCAALAAVWGGLLLTGASPAQHPTPMPAARAADAGPPASAPPADGGRPVPTGARDGGTAGAALSSEDREVIENLELLEHLPETEFLDLLVPAPAP